MRDFVFHALIRWVSSRREPDLTIGDVGNPYLKRWWVIPRNRFFNIYLHLILRDDDDRALHDHPWVNCSWILAGGYVEVTERGRFYRRPGSVTFRWPTTAHRLELMSPMYESPERLRTWSLFITGPVVRDWGFHCPQGWVPWRKFVAADNPGAVGRGCDQ
jgi:hypothetical protein